MKVSHLITHKSTTRLVRGLLTCAALATFITANSQKPKTENVVLITFDGLRWQELFGGADSSLVGNKNYVKDPVGLRQQFWAATADERRRKLMPFFWSTIAREGQLYGNRWLNSPVNCSNKMWFSYPGYNEILTGAADDARIKSNNKFNNPNITVLEYAEQQPAFKGKVAAFGSWDVFPFIINEERSKIPVNAGFENSEGKLTEREAFLNELQQQIPSPWAGVRLDAFTHHYAKEYVKKAKPRLLFISYGETDDFSHDGKYDAYLRSALQTDQFIADLWKFFQAMPEYKGKTTFIITTDHGRGTEPVDNWRNHGIDVPGAGEIWLAILGPDTPPLGEMKNTAPLFQNQVAGTVAAWLKLDYAKSRADAGAAVESAMGK